MNCTRLASGEYKVESPVGVFIVRRLLNVAAEDYQWGVFTEQHQKLALSWTKRDCEAIIETWEAGSQLPAAEDYDLEFPDYIGSKRVDLFTYRMKIPEGVFMIRKLQGRKAGAFRWGIFSTQGELVSEHFTRRDCESVVREWASVAPRHPQETTLRGKAQRPRPEFSDNWRNDNATEAQKALLKAKGVSVSGALTKGEASDQIDLLLNGITEGQRRRLHFYGISCSGVSKEKASDLIDSYVNNHPEAEERYQHWKAEELRKNPPDCMNREEWAKEMNEIEKHSVECRMNLAAKNPGDEAASEKQLQYIRSLVREIDEVKLQGLTKPQAGALIEEIIEKKKALSKDAAQRLLGKYGSAENGLSVKVVVMATLVGIVVGIFAYLVFS